MDTQPDYDFSDDTLFEASNEALARRITEIDASIAKGLISFSPLVTPTLALRCQRKT